MPDRKSKRAAALRLIISDRAKPKTEGEPAIPFPASPPGAPTGQMSSLPAMPPARPEPKPKPGSGFRTDDLLRGVLPAILLGSAGGPSAAGSFVDSYLSAKRRQAAAKGLEAPEGNAPPAAGKTLEPDRSNANDPSIVDQVFASIDPTIQDAQGHIALWAQSLQSALDSTHVYSKQAARQMTGIVRDGQIEKMVDHLRRAQAKLKIGRPYAADPAILDGYERRNAEIEKHIAMLQRLRQIAVQFLPDASSRP